MRGAQTPERTCIDVNQALGHSEAALNTLEGKGQALAVLAAIVAAALGAAISLAWADSSVAAKLLLVSATWYVLLSLHAPLFLAGPVPRACPWSIPAALDDGAIGMPLEVTKLRAVAQNRRTAIEISGRVARSRHHLLKALVLFTVWGLLALTGLGVTDPPHPARTPHHTNLVVRTSLS
jgi:hypothetical protein